MSRSPLRIAGKQASPIGFGCSRIGSFNTPNSVGETRNLLAAALDLGITLFDTADVYGQGDSERELGRLLSGSRRDRVIVVTKTGKSFSTKMRLLRPLKPLLKPLLSRSLSSRVSRERGSNIGSDFSPRRIAPAVERSLRRLRTESLDALLLHSPSAHALGDRGLSEALLKLQREGKIRSFGVSCDDVPALEASLDMPGLSLLELPADVLAEASSNGIGAEIRRRSIGVLAREVISLQRQLSPVEAVRACLGDGMTNCAVIGTTKIDHLEQIVRATAAPCNASDHTHAALAQGERQLASEGGSTRDESPRPLSVDGVSRRGPAATARRSAGEP